MDERPEDQNLPSVLNLEEIYLAAADSGLDTVFGLNEVDELVYDDGVVTLGRLLAVNNSARREVGTMASGESFARAEGWTGPL